MKNLIILAVVLAAAWFAWKKFGNSSSGDTKPAGGGGAAVDTFRCVGLAERANQAVSNAAMAATPGDSSRWSEAESAASAAISQAESCGGATTDAERKAQEEVRAACSGMRSLVSMFASAAAGSGGAGDAPRVQEEVDQHLDAARAALGR
jgi:hypothetical protein